MGDGTDPSHPPPKQTLPRGGWGEFSPQLAPSSSEASEKKKKRIPQLCQRAHPAPAPPLAERRAPTPPITDPTLRALILLNLNLNSTRNTHERRKTDTFPVLRAGPSRGANFFYSSPPRNLFFFLLQAGSSGGANFVIFFFFPLQFFFSLCADTAPNMCFKREKCEVFRSERKGPERRRQPVECASRNENTCSGFLWLSY